MPITAESADGTIHEFPDGTNPAVIDRVMKSYAVSQSQGSRAGNPTGVQAQRPGFLQDANDAMRQYAHRSLEDMRAQNAEQAKDPLQSFNPMQGFRTVGNAFNVALSPVAGAVIAGTVGARSAFGDRSGREDTDYNTKVGDFATGVASIPAGNALTSGLRRVGAVVGAVRDAVAVPRTVTTLSPVEASAASKLVSKAKLDVNAMTGEQARFGAANVPATVADVSGNSGRRIIRANASRPGPASDSVQKNAQAASVNLPSRLATQAEIARPSAPVPALPPPADLGDTVLGHIQQTLGIDPAAARGDMQGIVQQGRANATPLYEHAYAQVPPQSDELQSLLQRPSGRQALNRAARIAAEEGRDPTALGFDFNDAGDVVHVRTPSVQTLDYVKRGMDDVLNARRDPVTGKLNLDEEGRAILGTLNRFKELATNPNTPSGKAYGDAVNASGDYLSAQDAYGRAQGQVFSAKRDPRDFHDWFTGLSGGQQEAARAGVANDIFARVQSGQLKPGMFSTPAVQQKLATAFGSDAASNLSAKVEALTASASRPAAADVGGGVMTDKPSVFGPKAAALTSPERTAAQHAGVDAIQEAALKGPSTAPGVARAVALGDNQAANLTNLYDGDTAGQLANRFGTELERVNNAQQIAPQTGPWTANNAMDQALTQGVQAAGAAGKLFTGRPISAGIDAARLLLSRQGFSDQEAHALSMLAIDPSKTDEVIRYITAKTGPQAASNFLQVVKPAVANALNYTPPATNFGFVPAGANAVNALTGQIQPAQ